MAVTVLWRLCGSPSPLTGETGFSDVPEGQWDSAAIAWAQEKGTVRGETQTWFGGNDLVTREQLYVMTARLPESLRHPSAKSASCPEYGDDARMRCVSEDKEASVLMGINVNSTILLTFAIGSGLSAVAALMYMAQYPKVFTTMGVMLGLKAFVAAVLGGIGLIPGAMMGGLVIGLVESFTTAYVSSSMADTFVFLILIVVLILKPAGILGKNVGEKV